MDAIKNIALTMFIFFTGTLQAQKIQYDKVDAFTNNRGIKTEFVSLKGDFKVQLAAILSKTDTVFAMNFYFPTNVTSLDTESEVLFKLSDSSVSRYPYSGDYTLCSTARLCSIFISLKRQDLRNFLNNEIAVIRIKTSSGDLDFNIKEKKALMMNNLIKLMFDRLQKT